MTEAARKIDDEIEEQPEVNISTDRAETARSWLKDFRKHEGLEKIAIARRFGWGDHGRNRVHKFIEGEDDPGVVLAVERLRSTVDGPEGIAKYIGFRETLCARTVTDHALKIRAAGLFGAIVGPVGAGKSEALKKIQSTTKNDGLPPVRLLRCRSTMHLPGIVKKIAADMGIKGGESSQLHEQIVQRLSGRPEFLIVDEVDYLLHNERSLHFFRDLHDETGIGVLFSGQMYFLDAVWDRANRGAGARGEEGRLQLGGSLAAFADRLRVQVAPGLQDEEVIEIAEDVLKMELAEDAAKKLLVYVNHDFRVLAVMIAIMRELRLRAGRSVGPVVIEQSWAKAMHIKSRR